MLPTYWLDSWLGHLSTDTLLHNCPAISTTRMTITLTEVTVVFLRNNCSYLWINVYDTFFDIFSHQITPLPCEFLQSFAVFSLCQKESANMSADVIPSWHVTLSGMVQTTEFDKMSGQHSQHFCDTSAHVGMTCHLGGSGNTTQHRRFQLSHLIFCQFAHWEVNKDDVLIGANQK